MNFGHAHSGGVAFDPHDSEKTMEWPLIYFWDNKLKAVEVLSIRPSNSWSSCGYSVVNRWLYFAQFWSNSNKSGLLIIQDFFMLDWRTITRRANLF